MCFASSSLPVRRFFLSLASGHLERRGVSPATDATRSPRPLQTESSDGSTDALGG